MNYIFVKPIDCRADKANIMKTNTGRNIAIASGIICILLTVSLGGAISNYTSIISQQDGTIANQDSIINDLNSQIAHQNSQIAENNDTILALNAQIANLTSQVNSLNSQTATLQSQTSSDKSTITNLQSQVASANSQVNSLSSQVTTLQGEVNNLTTIINTPESKLQTLVFHVCEKGEGYEWGHIPDANSTYNQILALNNKYNVLLLPEYQGNTNWTEELTWLTANFGGQQGIPIMLDIFGGGNSSNPTPMLSPNDISSAMTVTNVQYLRFAEVISWHTDHPELPFPVDYVKSILEFCRANNLRLFWTEWKVETFETIQTYIKGYEDIVTISFSTNSGDVEPAEGFMQISQTFQHWGGSIQAWYWTTRYNSSLMDMPASSLTEHALFAKSLSASSTLGNSLGKTKEEDEHAFFFSVLLLSTSSPHCFYDRSSSACIFWRAHYYF